MSSHGRHTGASLSSAAGSAATSVLVAVATLAIGPALATPDTSPVRRPSASPLVPTAVPPTRVPYVRESVTPRSALRATLALAKAQVGISGTPNKFTRWYASVRGSQYLSAEWCAMFLVWVAHETGARVPTSAYTPSMAEAFRREDRWGTAARVGAFVFFDWGGSRDRSLIDHVGIVTGVHADGSVTSVEGNRGNAVRSVRHAANIVGYGYPAY